MLDAVAELGAAVPAAACHHLGGAGQAAVVGEALRERDGEWEWN